MEETKGSEVNLGRRYFVLGGRPGNVWIKTHTKKFSREINSPNMTVMEKTEKQPSMILLPKTILF